MVQNYFLIEIKFLDISRTRLFFPYVNTIISYKYDVEAIAYAYFKN